jgi:hypothetical protein
VFEDLIEVKSFELNSVGFFEEVLEIGSFIISSLYTVEFVLADLLYLEGKPNLYFSNSILSASKNRSAFCDFIVSVWIFSFD